MRTSHFGPALSRSATSKLACEISVRVHGSAPRGCFVLRYVGLVSQDLNTHRRVSVGLCRKHCFNKNGGLSSPWPLSRSGGGSSSSSVEGVPALLEGVSASQWRGSQLLWRGSQRLNGGGPNLSLEGVPDSHWRGSQLVCRVRIEELSVTPWCHPPLPTLMNGSS